MAIERGAQKNVRGRPRPRRTVFIEEKKPSELRSIWIALAGVYILFTESGIRQVLNGFVEPIIEGYKCSKSQADTAVLMIPIASSFIFGPLCSLVYKRAGARITIFIGATFCFLGFVAGPLCYSIYLLMICTFFIGIGCGLMRNSIISVQCEYFKKYQDVAMAFISIGPGIGIFALPRLQNSVMKMFDHKWKLAWCSLCLFYVLSGILALFITRKPSSQTSSLSFFESCKVFKKPEYIFHLLAVFFASSVTFIYLSNILILMSSQNIADKETVYSWQGIASIVARLIMTFLISLNRINNAVMIIISYVVAQLSLSSASLCYSEWQFRLQNIFSGLGIGFYQACFAPFIVALAGPSQFPYAIGYSNLINGISIFSSVWILKFASKGTTGEDSRDAFYISIWMGVLAISLSIIASLLVLSKERHKRKPSMKQLKHTAELNALTNIVSIENS